MEILLIVLPDNSKMWLLNLGIRGQGFLALALVLFMKIKRNHALVLVSFK